MMDKRVVGQPAGKDLPIDRDLAFQASVNSILARASKTTHTVGSVLNVIWMTVIAFIIIWAYLQITDKSLPTLYQEIQVMTPTVKLGERVKVRFKVYRTKTCPVSVSYTILDAANQRHDFEPRHRDASGAVGPDDFTDAFLIPKGTGIVPSDDTGGVQARIRITAAWTCPGNFYQLMYPVTKVFEDLPFTLTNP